MISNLPVNQIGESQWSSLQQAVEPATKIMQADLGSQACLKTSQGMRPFAGQPKGIEQLVKERLNQLAQARPSTCATLWASASDCFDAAA
jgi:hypothetical protein